MDNRRRAMDKCMAKQTAHTLIHSPAWKPVTHKLHSHNCDRPPLCSQKMTIKNEVLTAQVHNFTFRKN